MRITGYKREDFTRLMEISDACYTGIYRPPVETTREMLTISDTLIAREFESDCSLERVIGFAIVKVTARPYIWNIAVHPAYQGRGVGGNLLREIIKRYTLSKQKEIALHVNTENPAQKLYWDYGFRVVSVEEKYFNPHDGLLMVRRLP